MTAKQTTGRLRLFDTLRGFSVLSMVMFHLCYDLKFIAQYPMEWFAPPLQDIWRATISWTFIFVAGVMCSQSRNNLKRALAYGSVALGIYVATSVAAVDTPISFGIMYCMAACTFVAWLLQQLGHVPCGPVQGSLFFCLFILGLSLPYGHVGIGPLTCELPQQLYATPWLSWLGFPGGGFSSGDYYPLLPYLLLYFCGGSFGMWGKREGFPEFCYKWGFAPLEFVGRHALPIYVLHQPIILALVYLPTMLRP